MRESFKRMTKKRRLIAWLSSAAAVVILLALLVLILALTVFKPKHPLITVHSITVPDLDFSVDVARFRVHFNVTIHANVTVDNPNRVGFKFSNSSAILRFKGEGVGEVPIPGGEIGARDNRTFVLTLALMTDRMIFDSDFYQQVIAGTLHLQAFIRLAGKVRVVFDIHVISYTSCDFQLHVASKSVMNKTCHYKIKL